MPVITNSFSPHPSQATTIQCATSQTFVDRQSSLTLTLYSRDSALWVEPQSTEFTLVPNLEYHARDNHYGCVRVWRPLDLDPPAPSVHKYGAVFLRGGKTQRNS